MYEFTIFILNWLLANRLLSRFSPICLAICIHYLLMKTPIYLIQLANMDPKTRLDNGSGGEKRNVPPAIQKLLAIDVEMTKRFVSFSLNFVPIRSLKAHCKFLEVSKVPNNWLWSIWHSQTILETFSDRIEFIDSDYQSFPKPATGDFNTLDVVICCSIFHNISIESHDLSFPNWLV